MINIDLTTCNGCGACVEECPKKAISIARGKATINESLCRSCGICIPVCPFGAIYQKEPVSATIKGGENMHYGGDCGYGFRGNYPPWPYIGRGRGGLPRCHYPGYQREEAYYTASETPTKESELNLLKNQADAIKSQLEDVERRIRNIEQQKRS